MKKNLFTLLLLMTAISSFAQSNYNRRDAYITMRDGVKLFTIILEPADSAEHPVLMERTCYNVERRVMSPGGLEPYFENNYIIVLQDVRGRNKSDGKWEDIRAYIEEKSHGETDESTDAYDTIEWILANTRNNGRVGMKGISYPGFFSTMAALCGHPALKAVSPQAPVGDWFLGDDYHHNGAFMLADISMYDMRLEYNHNNRFRDNPGRSALIPNIIHTDIYTDHLKLGTYQNLLKALGNEHFFLDTCLAHPNYDSFWESHAPINGHLHDIKPAVLMVGGFWDKEDCFGTFATYNGIRKGSPATELFFVMGPWHHGAWARGFEETWCDLYFGPESTTEYYLKNIEYPFFAWYLEGKGNKPQQDALIFDGGSREWVRYPYWPAVAKEEATPFYLGADGALSTTPASAGKCIRYTSDPSKPVPFSANPVKAVSKDYMIYDQRFAATRPDVVCFSTPVLTEDLVLRGEIEVDLYVDITTTDADFIVKVIDVYPDDFSWRKEVGVDFKTSSPVAGYQLLLRGEPFRGKYRESFWNPKPFKPGKVTRVNYVMPDISHTLKAGHRLMIQVQSTWFPLVDRNPQSFCNIYECDPSAYVKADINIHCGGKTASNVKLPIIK